MSKENKINAGKMISEYAGIAFTLLGILFGMMIMTFIFGQLGSGSMQTSVSTETVIVTNETGAWLNGTTYTVSNSGAIGFAGLTITSAINTTTNTSIGTGNFSVTGAGYDNATADIDGTGTVWVSYTYTQDTDAKKASDQAQNNSLVAITTYTEGASTQLNTVSIAIILILLIGVFLVFWKIFVTNKKSSDTSGGNFG